MTELQERIDLAKIRLCIFLLEKETKTLTQIESEILFFLSADKAIQKEVINELKTVAQELVKVIWSQEGEENG